ncbi:MAG: (Fe-S)-binding protein, partial [Deltaproteobacteria bacterium]|nr:(Fe-S)-binding protein [Deltaproteobacteria bacterium]
SCIMLEFNVNVCKNCPTSDCLVKCQYMDVDKDTAREQMVKIYNGEDSFVLHDCVTCYACEEYCRRGNHPFYLITERREEKDILTTPRAITNQWVNIGEPTGKDRLGDVKERVLSLGFMPELLQLVRGRLFEDVMPSYLFGNDFFCHVVFIHFAKPSVIKERLPLVIDKYRKLGVKEVICMHDECYGAFASLAPAYGIEVPFTPIHYYEYLYDRLKALADVITPLNITVAYQRPCSARLSADKQHYVRDIMELIGVDLVHREYEDENALCCGEVMGWLYGYDLKDDLQKRNIDDMVKSGADYCFFNCNACQNALSEKVAKRGIKPVHMIDLCRMAIGEKTEMEV